MRRRSPLRRFGLWFARSNCYFFSRWILLVPGWTQQETRGYLARRPTIHWKLGEVRVGWHWAYIIPRRNGKVWVVHYDPGTPFTAEPDATGMEKARAFVLAAVHKLWFRGAIKRYDEEWVSDEALPRN